jgi:Asp-tRNA(Asn)/Glu-tRNA(Gln) amidotransferase A subunit family amidase
MALSWTMDKLGPICRRVEDCAIVLAAINGPDGHDRTVHDIPFNWEATQNLNAIRVGWLQADFEDNEVPKDEKPEQRERRLDWQRFNNQALEVIRTKVGIKLTSVKLPDVPWAGMRPVLLAEAAAAFDELTRSGRDKLLTAQGPNDWPNEFRTARFIPAVEYVNGNRARMEGMQKMAALFKDVDVIVAPTFSTQLLATNLTGHPAVILPDGFRADGTPTSLTFIGNLFGEEKLCAVARAYEQATEFHTKVPPRFKPGASGKEEVKT